MLNLLNQAPWMRNRTEAQHINTLMFSHVLAEQDDDGNLTGLIRFLTDHATITYLCDLIVDEVHRRQGIGMALMRRVLEHPDTQGTTVVVITDGAEEFYRKFGFTERTAMVRRADVSS